MALNHTQASAHVYVSRSKPKCQVIVWAGKNNRPAVNSRKHRPGRPRSTLRFNSGSDIKTHQVAELCFSTIFVESHQPDECSPSSQSQERHNLPRTYEINIKGYLMHRDAHFHTLTANNQRCFQLSAWTRNQCKRGSALELRFYLLYDAVPNIRT